MCTCPSVHVCAGVQESRCAGCVQVSALKSHFVEQCSGDIPEFCLKSIRRIRMMCLFPEVGCLDVFRTPFSPVLEVVWAGCLFDVGSNPQVREQRLFDSGNSCLEIYALKVSLSFCLNVLLCALSESRFLLLGLS